MKLTMRSPCDSCPFVRAHKFYLVPDRVRAIERHVGGGFPCHKTVLYGENGERAPGSRAQEVHCAGSLILQWKAYGGFDGFVTFVAQIEHRERGWTPETHLDLDADVFDDFDEMFDAMVELDERRLAKPARTTRRKRAHR